MTYSIAQAKRDHETELRNYNYIDLLYYFAGVLATNQNEAKSKLIAKAKSQNIAISEIHEAYNEALDDEIYDKNMNGFFEF